MTKKLTVAELLKMKDSLVNRKETTKNLYVESLASEITIKELPASIIEEATGMEERSDEYALLYGVSEPNLRDASLLAAYECNEPTDIVVKLFKVGEIKAIAGELMKLSGYGIDAVKVVDKQIKN
ncbi:hypothetical protein M6D81_11860 [Paenibacillus sp. J5C_2022]|uniref:phage tail assembly chaperone n=1 Tax=Paenibacillus sp. J5C2022 TaxID=2977129 RepID=UPI0021D0C99A|nr:hypothetical protein [Paenibacillus sp. J5C2022]MCU6709400.1 hypothetical protein [Paenibacillus sp. J5C2022]